MQNLHLTKGRLIISASPQLIIASDASLKGWGAFYQGHRTRGSWTLLESKYHINVLELKAAKFAILTFTRMYPSVQSIHLQMDHIVALSYLVKVGVTQNKVLSDLSKEIWDYLLAKRITITTEYLPGALNKETNFQLRVVRDSSKWKLDYKVFQTICRRWKLPDIDLFASRISHQVPTYISPTYMSWKLDPFSKGRDVFQITWIHLKGHAFPHFALIG